MSLIPVIRLFYGTLGCEIRAKCLLPVICIAFDVIHPSGVSYSDVLQGFKTLETFHTNDSTFWLQVDDFFGIDVQRLEDHLWLHSEPA